MIQDAFVALDFETANGKRTSICSVGMVKVIDSQITETFHTLVNPQDYFSQQNIKVHGIQPEDVENAPTFDYVFPYMMQFIADVNSGLKMLFYGGLKMSFFSGLRLSYI
ncbi:DNA polymerase III polC-type [Staphylococcus aureus]|nr:DNA polymerase III polC-type [Staphylococcus aureus]